MLPARQRITRSEFPQKKLCHTYYGKFFLLHYVKRGVYLPKVSVVISKKHSPSSVERHQIKRMVYGRVYQHINDLPLGSMLVFHLNRKIPRESTKQSVEEDVEFCVGQLLKK